MPSPRRKTGTEINHALNCTCCMSLQQTIFKGFLAMTLLLNSISFHGLVDSFSDSRHSPRSDSTLQLMNNIMTRFFFFTSTDRRKVEQEVGDCPHGPKSKQRPKIDWCFGRYHFCLSIISPPFFCAANTSWIPLSRKCWFRLFFFPSVLPAHFGAKFEGNNHVFGFGLTSRSFLEF